MLLIYQSNSNLTKIGKTDLGVHCITIVGLLNRSAVIFVCINKLLDVVTHCPVQTIDTCNSPGAQFTAYIITQWLPLLFKI